MSGSQHHRGGAAVAVDSIPVQGGNAPAVAGYKARESVLGYRCRQIIANGALVLQEFRGHYGADGVPSGILRPGRAAAVAVEADERAGAARFQRVAQHVAISRCLLGKFRPILSVNNLAVSRASCLLPREVARTVVADGVDRHPVV